MEERRPKAAAPVEDWITEADTATNRTGVSEDIDNQVFVEMNSGVEAPGEG